MKCEIEGCDGDAYGQGLCNKHWQRVRRTGTTGVKPRIRNASACSIEGCSGVILAHGLCRKHYSRMRKTGTTDPGPNARVHTVCTVNGCSGKHYGDGFCRKHYERRRATGTTGPGPKAQAPLDVRFWKKVDKRSETECWLWQGARRKAGYGSIGMGGKGAKNEGAHRVSYMLHNGVSEIPAGMVVMHACDTPLCVNPHHLSLGTHTDNVHDALNKGRFRGAAKGVNNARSKLTQEQVDYMRSATCMNKELAEMFGISQAVVSNIKRGKTYK